MRKNALRLLGALLALVVAAGPAAAQDRDAEMVDLTLVTSEGDVISTRTPNEDNLHVFGSFTVATADYFRGAFDGVEEDLDEWSYRPTLGLAVDLAQGTGALTNLSLTLGMANGFTNTDYDHAAKQRESWYKGDFFTGLAANLFDDFLAGLTYTAYTSPNDVLPTNHELAIAVGYQGRNIVGRLVPTVKWALPLDEEDGSFLAIGVEPAFTFFHDASYPVTVSLPLEIGTGFSNYYDQDEDEAGYFSFGLLGVVPLRFMPASIGSWRAFAGIEQILRDNDVADAGGGIDDDDNSITEASLGISFVF